MKKFTSRERIKFSLNHKEPDRIPVDLGSTYQTSIVEGAYINLQKYLDLKDRIEIVEPTARLVHINDEILKLFGVDTIQIIPNPPSHWKLNITEDEKNYYFINEWGISHKMSKNLTRYFDMFKFPLAGLSFEEIKRYRWPDPNDSDRYKGVKERARFLYDNTDKALVASYNGAGIFETACWMTGTEEFLVNMMLDKKKTLYVLDTITEIYIEIWKRYLEEIGNYIEVCALSDDLGIQAGPLISKDLFCEMVEPFLKKNIEAIKKRTNAKIYLHSCGDVSQFIPSLIDSGVDILNPIQVSAANMDNTAKLKRDYGKDLVFWGAACDPQKILPFGTKEEVINEVRRRINDLSPYGGFVFAPIHNIQSEVPPENIVNMFETALRFGKY